MKPAIERVTARLASFSPSAVRKFACACATRVFPVIEETLPASSTEVVRDVLMRAWANSFAGDEADRALAALTTLPDADLDDSLDRRYYGMLAVGAVHAAVRAAAGQLQYGAEAASTALTLADALPPVDGQVSLADKEEAAQTGSLDMLDSGRDVGIQACVQLGEEFRTMAKRLAPYLNDLVPRRTRS